MRNRNHAVSFILAFILIAAAQVFATSEPEPGVARVSLVKGDVTRMRGDSGDWVALTVNAPLVSGDTIATGPRSRTEVQLDYANVMRIGEETEARIADLEHSRIQIQLTRGILNLTVEKGNDADVEIDTPNVAMRPLKEGRYRIQVNERGETEVIVRKGEAEVYTSDGSLRVGKNDMAVVRGPQDDPEYRVMNAPGRDAWDEWNEDRDDTIRSARSWKYTSPYYTGAHDLDRYGRWVYIPGYDWVWRPAVDPYWAPYRAGRWVWEPYWGWTWVSYEPWGWAPYHYGRWFSYANVWYWWPGPVHRHYRPRWAPAFVTFFGFGAGKVRFSFGFGFGYSSIGWLPVGPCDYYYPWYGRHRHRYNVVHVTNVTNVYNVHHDGAFPPLGRGRPHGFNVRDAFSNPRLRNSITAVGTDDFVRGRIGSRSQRIDEHQLRQAHLVAGSPPVVPTRESLRVSDRSVSPPRGALRQSSERMFARRTPPEIRHSFSENASAMREMVQRIDPARALRGSERGVASADGNRVSQPAAGRPNGTFDGPANSFNSNRSEGAGSRERSTTIEPRSQGEWQRFGGASSNRRDPGNRTDNSRIESGKSSVERPSVTPAPRSGSSREVRPERSREAPSSQRRSVAPAPSRSREESSTPSRRSGSGQNRGPSEPRETVRFMTIPRGDSESSRVGSVRSSGPTVITIPRESNKANDTIAAPRREGPSQSERQFRETPREIPRTTPSFSRSPERNSESQSILRSPRIQRETPRSFQRESPRQYQRESQAQPRLQSSQPRYQASPSYRSSPGGSSYRVQRGGGHSGSFRSSPSSSARSGGASRRGRH